MAISADMVKKLREQTGAGMMDCKKALTETGGDYEKAVTLLREKGIAVAAKRETRAASEGMIGSYISDDAKIGALVETNCETTFVAKTDEFVSLTKDLAEYIAKNDVGDNLESLMGQQFRGTTVQNAVNDVMGKVGEKTTITRFAKLQTDGVIGSYVHMGDQIAVIVEIKGSDKPEVQQLAKDIAMHVSWSNPEYMTKEDVPADAVKKEREIHRAWAIKEGKPEKVIDRIVDGRMSEFYSRTVLIEQPFIKDEEKSIKTLISDTSKQVGAELSVAGFVRFRVGESTGDAE